MVVGVLLLGCSEPAPEPPVARHDAQRLNRACASCHVEIAGEWARSEHHRSADAVFRAALRREPLRFCESCHAPGLTPPTMGAVRDAAAGVNGSLWLVTASSAFVLGAQGAWRELAVPSAASLKSTVVEGLVKPEGALHLELSSVAATSESHGLIAGSLYDAASNAQSTFLFASDDKKLERPKIAHPRRLERRRRAINR